MPTSVPIVVGAVGFIPSSVVHVAAYKEHGTFPKPKILDKTLDPVEESSKYFQEDSVVNCCGVENMKN